MDELFYEVDALIEKYVNKNFKQTTAIELGFERRVTCRHMYVSEDAIAVKGHTGNLDYYGGMEYVTDEDRKVIGEWTFYLAENNDRVREHVATALKLEDVEDTDEE